jgi:uncharacterized membrane protein
MTMSDRDRSWQERAFVAALVTGSLLLRVYRIGKQSLWVDEVLTLDVSIPRDGLTIWNFLKYNIHGPLHSFAVYLFHLVGAGDAWLRLPSALAGAGAVAYFYLWTRPWLGRRVARIASVILAVHPLHLYYSQELRNYSFLLFFAMLGCYYFEKMTTGSRRRDRVGYVAAIACAALSNFTAAYLYLTHCVIYFSRKGLARKTLLRWAGLSLAILLIISPWVYRIYQFIDVSDLVTPVRPGQLDEAQRLRGETTITPAALPYALYTYSVGFSMGPSTRELHRDSSLSSVLRSHLGAVAWVTVLFGGLVVVGSWRIIRRGAPSKELFLYLLVPLVLTFLLNWQNAKAFNVRYVLLGFPAYVCLLAVGLAGVEGNVGRAWMAAVLATLLVSDGGYYFNPKYARDDVRGAVRYIEAHGTPGECIVAPTVIGVVEHYYRGVEEVHSVFNRPGQPRAVLERQLREIFAWCNSVWYIRARPWVDDPNGYVLERMSDHYRELQLVDFDGVQLYRFGPKKGID